MFTRRTLRMGAACVIAVAVSGCAARHHRLSDAFVKPGTPSVEIAAPIAKASPGDLRDYMQRVRAAQANARTPKVTSMAPTLESHDPALSRALLVLAMQESAENHRRVAAAYRNAGVSDFAYRHLQKAVRLEPCGSATYEALAQIWRDWQMPDLALTDAHRAVYCAPGSASAQNTLGTILESLGDHKAAEAAFSKALRLDAHAAFALNNLCYLSLQNGDAVGAERSCARALDLDPGLVPAQNNLAMAYALQGRTAQAEARLIEGADAATGHYNVGILRMSLGQYAAAAQSFGVAASERPSLADAARRAIQARKLAAAQPEH